MDKQQSCNSIHDLAAKLMVLNYLIRICSEFSTFCYQKTLSLLECKNFVANVLYKTIDIFRDDQGKDNGPRGKRTLAERRDDARRERQITRERMDDAKQAEALAVEMEGKRKQEEQDKEMAMAISAQQEHEFARKEISTQDEPLSNPLLLPR